MRRGRSLPMEFPGVNVSIPISEQASLNTVKSETPPPLTQDPISLLADAMWPHLRRRVEDLLRNSDIGESHKMPGRTKRKGVQPQLPLADDTKRNR